MKMSAKIRYGSSKSKAAFAKETTEERTKHDDIWYGDTTSIKNYIRSKLKMLRNEMLINPTEEEIEHLKALTNTVAIDNAVHSIIERHWSKW